MATMLHVVSLKQKSVSSLANSTSTHKMTSPSAISFLVVNLMYSALYRVYFFARYCYLLQNVTPGFKLTIREPRRPGFVQIVTGQSDCVVTK